MNFREEFDRALTMEEYLPLLGDKKPLHDLHYKKAQIEQDFSVELLPLRLLIITEPWCGDSTAILPVLMKIAETQQMEMRVLLRDENPKLIDLFLTRGGRAIPVILILNENGDLLGRFGPRPKKAQDIYEQERAEIEAGRIEKIEVIKKIRNFYSKDRGKVISEEFIHLLEEVLACEEC